MAINFPNSPADDDTHTVGEIIFTYNAAKNSWTSLPTIATTIVDGLMSSTHVGDLNAAKNHSISAHAPSTIFSVVSGAGHVNAPIQDDITNGRILDANNDWIDPPGGSPGGADKQIQFNDNTAFGGDPELTYDKNTDTLSAINLEVHSIQGDPSLTGTYTISAPASISLNPGTEVVNMGPMTLVSKTVVELSSLPASNGAMVFCTNATGGSVPAFYDGTSWLRITDRTIIS